MGKMRDFHALQLFSLENYLKCLQEDRTNELVYLLPFALQEEVLRNAGLTGEQRLEKAILSFKQLRHYFHLSSFPRDQGVTKQFLQNRMQVLTFADDTG
jgi:hypothetical protein